MFHRRERTDLLVTAAFAPTVYVLSSTATPSSSFCNSSSAAIAATAEREDLQAAQVASFLPAAQKASFLPAAQKASFLPAAQKASFLPAAQKASFLPAAQKASFLPAAQKASFLPAAQKASFLPLEQSQSHKTYYSASAPAKRSALHHQTCRFRQLRLTSTRWGHRGRSAASMIAPQNRGTGATRRTQ